MKLILILGLVFVLARSSKIPSQSGFSYDGYKVLRLGHVNEKILREVHRFLDLPDVSLWTADAAVRRRPLDVLVGPNALADFHAKMEQLRVPVTTAISDVDTLIRKEKELNNLARRRSKPSSGIDHSYYRNLDEIYGEMNLLVKKHPNLLTLTNIGQTFLEKPIKMMKVSVSQGVDEVRSSRPVIWIDCGIHAREWITPATCLYILDQLSRANHEKEIFELISTYDFYILPVTNPDGYDYTWTDYRLWRKNRLPDPSGCFGVDLNRNFDADFGGPGTSSFPCSDIYHGSFAFSEAETKAIEGQVRQLGSRLKAYFNLHSFSQLWMYPYGYTYDTPDPDDNTEMRRVAEKGVKSLEAVYGTDYTFGNIATTIYLAAGSSVDWTYDSAGVLYSYALELRDTGEYGFELPPDQIEPTANETWRGIMTAVKAMR